MSLGDISILRLNRKQYTFYLLLGLPLIVGVVLYIMNIMGSPVSKIASIYSVLAVYGAVIYFSAFPLVLKVSGVFSETGEGKR